MSAATMRFSHVAPRDRVRVPLNPLFAVLVVLAVLAAAPDVLSRRLQTLRVSAEQTSGAARDVAADLRIALAKEGVAFQAYRASGASADLASYRATRADEERLFSRLLPITREMGGAVAEEALDWRMRSVQLHLTTDARADGRIGEREFDQSMVRIRALGAAMRTRSETLMGDLDRSTAADIARAQQSINVQMRLTTTLALFAALAVVVAGVLGRRERRKARELLDSVEAERVLAADAARRSDELTRAVQSRSRLLRGFSHDLKNPLGAVAGQLELLHDGLVGPLDDVQAKSVERARRSLQGALALIDELLVLARAESGVMLVVRRSTDMHALVNDVVDEYRSQIDARGLAVEVALARAPHVLTDAAKVRQILGNLVSNAVKYTERGRIRIAVGEGFSAPSGAYCRGVFIEVSDTGLGVPSDQQELLFGEFVRLHPTAAPGAGIGLAISRRVADAIGGDVRLTLSNASGSTFTLWLPLDEPFTPRRSAARTEITESGQANAPRLRGAFG